MFSYGDKIIVNNNYPLGEDNPGESDLNVKGLKGKVIEMCGSLSPFYGQYKVELYSDGGCIIIGILHPDEFDLIEE